MLIIDDNFLLNFFYVGYLFLEFLRFIFDKFKILLFERYLNV